MAEVWRFIPGYQGYTASSEGRIAGRRGVMAVRDCNGSGYLAVGLWKDGQKHNCRVNRLVCAAFHGEAPSPDHEAAHEDGSRANNASANLSWKTRVENCLDRVRHGTHVACDNHPRAQLSGEAVVALREAHAEHMAQRRASGMVRPRRGWVQDAATRLGVSAATVKDVTSGRTWNPAYLPPHPLYLRDDTLPQPWMPA